MGGKRERSPVEKRFRIPPSANLREDRAGGVGVESNYEVHPGRLILFESKKKKKKNKRSWVCFLFLVVVERAVADDVICKSFVCVMFG